MTLDNSQPLPPLPSNPGESKSLSHLAQLDGIRAIAVMLVMVHHLMPRGMLKIYYGGETYTPFTKAFPAGAMGVGIFFVLSGFLITRILLSAKTKVEAGKVKVGHVVKQFYIRRFLRIFPLYYGTIAVLWYFNVWDFAKRAWWHVAYLSNWYYVFPIFKEKDPIRWETHFWTLSVEEQFYIFWPLLILLTPRKWLLWMVGITILIAPIFRAIVYSQVKVVWKMKQSSAHEWLTPGCLDLLGGGALLAILMSGIVTKETLKKWLNTLGWFILPTMTVWLILTCRQIPIDFAKQGGLVYPMIALLGIWMVGTASYGFKGIIAKVLMFKPLVYTGRISYGLYVLHMLVPHLLEPYLMHFRKVNPWSFFWVCVAVSYTAATISWYCYEGPLNSLKRYFEYDSSKNPPVSPPASNSQ